MRVGLLIFTSTLAVVAGCHTYKMESTFPPPPFDGASFEAAPSRQVYDDGGLVGTGKAPDGPNSSGGGLGPGQVGPNMGSQDAAAPVADAAAPPADASPDGSCTQCDLLTQNCPSAAQACYPAGGGRACCAPAGATGALSPCIDSTQCDRGLLCVLGAIESLCQPICSVGMGVCPGGVCRALTGYPGVGYCAP
jgi:hypothetical protein